MEKEWVYVFLVLVLGVVLLTSFTDFNKTNSFTGRVIGENETNETVVTNETCVEDWSCEEWSVCGNETQTRTCTDINTCETELEMPDLTQSCVLEIVNTTNETDINQIESINETCVENWSCADWDTCVNETQLRICTDANTCSTELEKPNETQSCVVENITCVEDWSCEVWSDCDGGTKTRTCADENDCETELEKPDESQTCVVEEDEVIVNDDEEIIVNTPFVPTPTPTPSAPEEPKKEELGGSEQLTGQIINIFNETNCTGCVLNDRCYDFNKTKKGDYCLENGSWAEQFAFNETCINNFECDSNSCNDGFCAEKSILQKLFEWFSSLFQFEMSSDANQTNLTENETLNL